MANTLRFLCIGDVIGQPGMAIFQRWVPRLKEQYAIDAIIVNGENAAKNGKGITPRIIDFFKHHDVAVITTGNHIWEQREVYAALEERDDIVRPANYPPGCPGKGLTFFTINGHTVAVVNLHGRVFVRDLLDCPFRAIESLLTFVSTRTNIILVDFHAEATSEKNAMGMFLDGRSSCVYGTHTHVQTADEHILPQGTGFITDIGSCGALYSVIGMQKEAVLNRFLYHPRMGRFEVETTGPIVLSGIWFEVDVDSGNTVKIERIRIIDETISQTIDAT
jgi:2',3'-cyclic-nucleotide 2'-phosphodiesterase